MKTDLKLRGMLHFGLTVKLRPCGQLDNFHGHAPHVEKDTLQFTLIVAGQDWMRWAAIMWLWWTTVIVWSCMSYLSIILRMNPLRCLAVRRAPPIHGLGDSHHRYIISLYVFFESFFRYAKAGEKGSHMKWTLWPLWCYAVVCPVMAQSCSDLCEALQLSRWKWPS